MGVVDTLTTAAKIVSTETMETFARSLARLHRPMTINYAAKFGVVLDDAVLDTQNQPASSGVKSGNESKTKNICEACGAQVEDKVVSFCKMNKAKFGGKTLCRACQKKPVPSVEPDIIELTDIVEIDEGSGHRTCEKCGTPVDKKVAYFCRINKMRFAGKILCRTCQKA